ncbi:MAG: ATP-binding protein [Chloroflexota bacterium]
MLAAQDHAFSERLRRLRIAAHLTQEELAERAGLTAKAIGALERGERRHPYPHTLRLLGDALGLSIAERAALKLAVPGRDHPAASVPALTTPPLPLPLTRLIGREQAEAEVAALLRCPDVRLVTLSGPGGIGKTRLALQVAAEALGRYPDGVWLVELAALTDPALVAALVAAAVAVRERPSQSIQDALLHAFRPKRLLLVLDNCEHLLDTCARLADALLRGCPGVQILATSREALGVTGETVRRVPALATPPRDVVQAELLICYDAVQLFVQRARAVQAGFALTDQNGRAVAELCRRLDGIPLALELAAARVGALSVEQLAARLDQRLRLLSGGNRAALPRQQTVQATIDWSYDLLSESERRLFERLSIFAGGWALEAAEAVCPGDGIAPENVLDLLLRLVDKSLVVAEEQPDGSMRYRLLEALHLYAQERLTASGASGPIQSRHAAHFLALARRAGPQAEGPGGARWLEQLEREHDNVRATLRWTIAREEVVPGMELARVLGRFWRRRGHAGEGRQWLAELLALPQSAAYSVERAMALQIAGHLASFQGDDAVARRHLEESLALRRTTGDYHLVCQSLRELGHFGSLRGDHALAWSCFEEFRKIAIKEGDPVEVAWSLSCLGHAARAANDPARARAFYEQACARFKELGERWGTAWSLYWLAAVTTQPTAVGQILEEALALFRDMGNPEFAAAALRELGSLARRQGDPLAARRHYEESLQLDRAQGDRPMIAADLADLARLAWQQGDYETACLFQAESLAIWRDLGEQLPIAVASRALADMTEGRGEFAAPPRALRETGAPARTA